MKFLRDERQIFNIECLLSGEICYHGELCLKFKSQKETDYIYLHSSAYEEEYPNAKEAIIHCFEKFLDFMESRDEFIFDFSVKKVMRSYESYIRIKKEFKYSEED